MKLRLLATTGLLTSLLCGSAVGTAAPIAPSNHAAGSGGMGSPEAAVDELLASVGASDPLGLLAVLHPDERYLVDTLYSNTTATAASGGALDVQALMRSLHIEVLTGPLVVEPLNDHVAWVTTDSADVMAQVDIAQLDASMAADLSDADAPAPYEDHLTPQADGFGIAVVNEGGQWFVSALYTAAETARRNLDVSAGFGSAPAASGKSQSPVDAVIALTDAVASQDLAAVAAKLTPFERRLVADYTPTIGAELLGALASYSIDIDPTHIDVVDEGDGWAIVEVDRWHVAATGETEWGDPVDWQLTVDGYCGEFREFDEDEFGVDTDVDGTCLFTSDDGSQVLAPLTTGDWRGPRFVVVNGGDGWSVSLLQTSLNALAPFTTDAVTFASVAELFGTIFWESDQLYPALFEMLTVADAPLPIGPSIIQPRGIGRVALFRASAGTSVTVDIAGDPRVCAMFVVDPDSAYDWIETFECDESTGPLPGDAVVGVVTSRWSPFTGTEPLGEVTVTVTG